MPMTISIPMPMPKFPNSLYFRNKNPPLPCCKKKITAAN